MHIFNPSSSVFVKHWMCNFVINHNEDLISSHTNAGYINTTTALTRFRFKFASGNIDSGDILLFGSIVNFNVKGVYYGIDIN